MSTTKRRTKSRGNGTGTAYKRGNTWTAVAVVDWKPSTDGTHKIPIYKTKGGFSTKRDALNYCPTLLANKTGERKVPNLKHYWDQYERDALPLLSKDKQYAYKGAWKRMASIQYYTMDSITVSDVRTCVSQNTKTYYPAKDMKTLFSHLFNLARADRYITLNLSEFVILPELNEKERIPFNEAEQKSLWKAYEDGDRRAAIPLIMIYTGMMPGEMQNLRKDSVHIDDQLILDAGMKTKIRKKSPVFIPDAIVPVLIEEMDQSLPDSEYVWIRNEKKFYRDYYDILQKTGCRKLEPYSCRHTTATALAVDQNIAPQTIRKIMRWTTTKQLNRYAHPDKDDALSALNSIKKD